EVDSKPGPQTSASATAGAAAMTAMTAPDSATPRNLVSGLAIARASAHRRRSFICPPPQTRVGGPGPPAGSLEHGKIAVSSAQKQRTPTLNGEPAMLPARREGGCHLVRFVVEQAGQDQGVRAGVHPL